MAATVDGVRRWTMPLLIVLLAAVAVGGYWLSDRALTAQVDNRSLHVADAALDVGTVWSQELAWQLPVHNPSSEPIELLRIQSDCLCTAVDFESQIIQPGQTVNVALRVNLMGGDLFPTDEPIQTFDVSLKPIVRGTAFQQPTWILHGHVRRSLTVSPESLQFGDLYRDSPSPAKTVAVQSHVGTSRLVVSCDPAESVVVAAPKSGSPGAFLLTVEPSPLLPPGDFEVTILVAPAVEGERVPPVPVTVSGRIVGDIQMSPDRIALPPDEVGKTLERVVSFTSRGSLPFEVEDVEVASPHVSVIPLPSDAPHRRQFRIARTIANLGDEWTNVRFRVRDSSGELLDFTLPLFAHGLPRSEAQDIQQSETPHAQHSTP